MISRRSLTSSALFLAGAAAVPHARAAETFPNRTIRMIVPFPPGASTDTLGRLVARGMSERLGRPVIVENPSGAGGAVGVDSIVRADPDGYSILFTVSGPITLIPLVNRSIRYKLDDLEPIGIAVRTPLIVAVSANSPWKTLGDLVAAGKDGKGEAYNFASPGVGSVTHVASEMINIRAGTNFQHIPYKGTGEILVAMASGDVQWDIVTGIDGKAQFADGRLRPLAVLSEERSPSFPAIPTAREAGLDGVAATAWYGLFAPKRTPPAIRDALGQALRAVLADPAFGDRMAFFGADLGLRDLAPDQIGAFMVAERDTYAKVVHTLDLVAN